MHLFDDVHRLAVLCLFVAAVVVLHCNLQDIDNLKAGAPFPVVRSRRSCAQS
jgi:hypothetical protein